MRSYRYLHYDVFTSHLFSGNQLAVFPDGRGLPAATRQGIAKEMNFSETTFVLPAERPDRETWTAQPRPGRLECVRGKSGYSPGSVRVGGEAVLAGEGVLYVT